jgi:hypothetical protein
MRPKTLVQTCATTPILDNLKPTMSTALSKLKYLIDLVVPALALLCSSSPASAQQTPSNAARTPPWGGQVAGNFGYLASSNTSIDNAMLVGLDATARFHWLRFGLEYHSGVNFFGQLTQQYAILAGFTYRLVPELTFDFLGAFGKNKYLEMGRCDDCAVASSGRNGIAGVDGSVSFAGIRGGFNTKSSSPRGLIVGVWGLLNRDLNTKSAPRQSSIGGATEKAIVVRIGFDFDL